jgi:hypothetical protein
VQEDEGGSNEYMERVMAVWSDHQSDETDKFFAKLGEDIMKFALANELTTDDLAAELGRVAGRFSLTAIRANPEAYQAASEDYVSLCLAAVELSALTVLDEHEGGPAEE